jgi:hypothetical protein
MNSKLILLCRFQIFKVAGFVGVGLKCVCSCVGSITDVWIYKREIHTDALGQNTLKCFPCSIISL